MWTSNDHVIYKLNKNNRVAMPDSPFTEEEDPTGYAQPLLSCSSLCCAYIYVNTQMYRADIMNPLPVFVYFMFRGKHDVCIN